MAASTVLTNVIAGAIIGAATSALMGGDPLTGALFGGLGGAARGAFDAAGAAGAEGAAAPAGAGAEMIKGTVPLGAAPTGVTMPIPVTNPDELAAASMEKGAKPLGYSLGKNEFKETLTKTATGSANMDAANKFDLGAAHVGDEAGDAFGSDWLQKAHGVGDEGSFLSGIMGEEGLLSAKNIGSGFSTLAKIDAYKDRQELANEGAMDLQIQAQQNKYPWEGGDVSRPVWLAQLVSTNPRAVKLSQVYTGHPGYETQYAAA
jgi:hypothetical protein